MTDRYNTLTVVLDQDIRDDDAEPLLMAIRMLRGVLSVQGNVANGDALVAEHRAKSEMRRKLYQVLE